MTQARPEQRAQTLVVALDDAALERLALRYVARYATTRARVAGYLRRKLKDRGWGGPGVPQVDDLVERMAALGYVDDRAFAEARSAGLARRGYGGRRVGLALRAAGVSAHDISEVVACDEDEALALAITFAKRRRIGPFADGSADAKTRRRAFAAMQRAGHVPAIITRVLSSELSDLCDPD